MQYTLNILQKLYVTVKALYIIGSSEKSTVAIFHGGQTAQIVQTTTQMALPQVATMLKNAAVTQGMSVSTMETLKHPNVTQAMAISAMDVKPAVPSLDGHGSFTLPQSQVRQCTT